MARDLAEDFKDSGILEKPSREELAEHLKPEINNLLHTRLPHDITVGEAEIIAIVIFEMIYDPHSFVKVDSSASSTEG